MKINRRSFLAGGALGGASAIFSAQAGAHPEPDVSIRTKQPRVIAHRIKDAGNIPNSRLPLLVYQGALELPKGDPAAAIEALIHSHEWGNDWRNGIFSYHHYHSTAHEALVVYEGSAKVQLGGESGPVETINAGDVIIIPAGVGHKNLGASSDFQVVGAYPPEQFVDMCYGRPGERPRTDQNIARVALPSTDPVFGASGPLRDYWRAEI
ncbi:MAG: cupin domain-containing protein [Acidobacteria bacterium]|nr:cupin domain-containing protein [Acidobacteriota bacterium]